MHLQTPLSEINGIGPAIAKRLEKLELYTVEDLINHYPFRYEDFTQIKQISEARAGETATFRGDLWSIKNTYTRFRKTLTKALLNDGSGSLELVWFNNPWIIKNLKNGDKIQVSGKVDTYNYKLSLIAPDWEKIISEDQSGLHTGRLVPVYPETYGLSSKWLRQKIAQILPRIVPSIQDPLPETVRQNKYTLQEALTQIHFPDDQLKLQQAKHRIAFDELFYIQLNTLKLRQNWEKQKVTIPLKIDLLKLEEFISQLPFELTNAQRKVIDEIIQDLQKNHPMNRLIQGDVGSGKTVVAAAVAYLAHLNNLQTVFMAPTEILAFQHHQTLSKLLKPYGIKVGIYTGSRKYTKDKSTIPSIIIGTHALLSDKLALENVGLIIVDEQHRFGVAQRSLLREKAKSPHFLTMTATPIPRTVALTLYGDLDLSIIDELPKGRKVIRTHYVPKEKRADAYKFIGEKVLAGQQAYIITPLIDESETLASVKSAKAEYERLKKEVFPGLRLGLLHGKLSSRDKEQVLNDFKEHNLDILVSTSVVEVGVDIPNATIMVIEGAERFGLAGLHQLRGRVGRGQEQSYAFLFTEEPEMGVVSRLKQFEVIYDGLKLAELDLKIRGSGEIFGIRQSGRWNLKVASLSDLPLIEETREAAKKILWESPDLDKYPALSAKLESLGAIMPD